MSAPSGEAALYQRLRAHLDFLKLPAAAEALPGILDAARDQDRSTVRVLEALLAVEVDTTQARRLASRLRFACLPTLSSLDTFDFTAQPGVDVRAVVGEPGGCPFASRHSAWWLRILRRNSFISVRRGTRSYRCVCTCVAA